MKFIIDVCGEEGAAKLCAWLKKNLPPDLDGRTAQDTVKVGKCPDCGHEWAREYLEKLKGS